MGENNNLELVFRYLYDEVYAYFPKKERYETPNIVLARGFIPEVGKAYECDVRSTVAGTFFHEGVVYDLSIATLINDAVADSEPLLFGDSKEDRHLTHSLGDAFKRAKRTSNV